MGFFNDFASAVEDYPVTDVDLEIVDVTWPDNVLNAGEEGTFKVKITNRGPLNLTAIKLLVEGQHGVTVQDPSIKIDPPVPTVSAIGTPIPTNGYSDKFTSTAFQVLEAHKSMTVGAPFKYKAPDKAQDAKTILKATIAAWDADLTHLLIDHSEALPDAPKG